MCKTTGAFFSVMRFDKMASIASANRAVGVTGLLLA